MTHKIKLKKKKTVVHSILKTLTQAVTFLQFTIVKWPDLLRQLWQKQKLKWLLTWIVCKNIFNQIITNKVCQCSSFLFIKKTRESLTKTISFKTRKKQKNRACQHHFLGLFVEGLLGLVYVSLNNPTLI